MTKLKAISGAIGPISTAFLVETQVNGTSNAALARTYGHDQNWWGGFRAATLQMLAYHYRMLDGMPPPVAAGRPGGIRSVSVEPSRCPIAVEHINAELTHL